MEELNVTEVEQDAVNEDSLIVNSDHLGDNLCSSGGLADTTHFQVFPLCFFWNTLRHHEPLSLFYDVRALREGSRLPEIVFWHNNCAFFTARLSAKRRQKYVNTVDVM